MKFYARHNPHEYNVPEGDTALRAVVGFACGRCAHLISIVPRAPTGKRTRVFDLFLVLTPPTYLPKPYLNYLRIILLLHSRDGSVPAPPTVPQELSNTFSTVFL